MLGRNQAEDSRFEGCRKAAENSTRQLTDYQRCMHDLDAQAINNNLIMGKTYFLKTFRV